MGAPDLRDAALGCRPRGASRRTRTCSTTVSCVAVRFSNRAARFHRRPTPWVSERDWGGRSLRCAYIAASACHRKHSSMRASFESIQPRSTPPPKSWTSWMLYSSNVPAGEMTSATAQVSPTANSRLISGNVEPATPRSRPWKCSGAHRDQFGAMYVSVPCHALWPVSGFETSSAPIVRLR